MSVFAVIEPKEEYNRQNEAAFREEVRSLGNSSYDKRGNLTVPIGKKLQFTSPTGVVVTLGFDGGNFTIQQNTSTPFSLASISYVTTIENGLASRTSALETTVNTPVTGLTARITAEEQTRAGADSALALRASNLEASVDNPATGLLARATSLETRVTTVETGKASTTVTDTIDAKIENPTTGLKARATSLESRVTTVETDKASASSVSTLSSRVTSAENEIDAIPSGADAGLDGSFRFGGTYWTADQAGPNVSGAVRTVEERTNGLRVSVVTATAAAAGTTSDFSRTRGYGTNGAKCAPGDIVGARVFAGGTNVSNVSLRLAFRNNAGTLIASFETPLAAGIPAGTDDKNTFAQLTVAGTCPAGAFIAHVELLYRPAAAGSFVGRFCEPAIGIIPNLTAAPPRFTPAGDAAAGRLVTAESNITNLQSTTADLTNNKAEASTVTALTARVASGDATGLIRNARFAEPLVAGLPPGWSNWANGTGTAVARWVHTGGNAFRLVGPVNAGGGLQASSFPTNSIRGGSRFRVLIEAVLVSGTYDGSGVFIDWRTAGGVALTPDVRIGLANTADTSATVSNSAAGFRSWDVEVTAPATAAYANFYVMSHWSNHAGGQAVANSIDWHLVDLVPVSNRLASAEANITNLQTTTSNLNLNKAEASTVTTLSSRVSAAAGGMDQVEDFAADGLHWTTNFGGSPGTIADAANGATYVNVAGIGRCLQINTYPFYLTPKAAFKPAAGRRYRLTVRASAGADASVAPLTVAINNVNGLNLAWAHGIPSAVAYAVPGVSASANVTVAEGFKTISREWALPDTLQEFDAAWRLRIDVTRPDPLATGGTVLIADFRVEDVTDVLAATARGAAAEGSGLVKNSLFQVPFSGTQIPPDWNSFANGTGTQVDRTSGTGKAYRLVSNAGQQSGNQQSIPDGSLKPGRYTLRAKLRRVAGTLDGAAAYISFRNSANTVLQDFAFFLATTANTAGETRTDPDGITTWELPVTAPANTSRGVIYFMNHYSPAGSIALTNTIDWHEVDLFPVTNADVRVAAAEANITTLQSTTSTANSAIASLQTLLTSRVGQKPASLLVNPAFSDYPVASASIPPGWANWGNGLSSSRGAGRVGTYAHIQEGVAAQNAGLYQNRRMEPGKHNIDIAIERSVGTLTGGGVLIQYFNSSSTYISETQFPFASISDTRGGVGVSVGYDYRTFRLAFTAPANTYTANVYLMNHWDIFGDISTYNQIYWHQVDVTPVDYGSATVDALATTVATVDGKLSASYGLTVDAGGRIASMKLLSNGTTSSVKFTASTFQIYNNTTDEAPFEVVGGVVKIKSANVGTLNVGSGGVTIQSAAPGSARIVMSNSVIEVFDGSSVRRVRMGVW